jgi:hypothetical protein
MMYLKQAGSTRTDFAAFALIERDALEICNLSEYPRRMQKKKRPKIVTAECASA